MYPDLGGADAGDVPGRSCDREQEGAGKKKRKQLHGVPRIKPSCEKLPL